MTDLLSHVVLITDPDGRRWVLGGGREGDIMNPLQTEDDAHAVAAALNRRRHQCGLVSASALEAAVSTVQRVKDLVQRALDEAYLPA